MINEYLDFNKLLTLNYKKIGLSDDEFILLSISYTLVKSGTTFVDPSDLSLLCNFSSAKCDVIYSGLVAKKYISNEFDKNNIMYTSFDGVIDALLKGIKNVKKENKDSASILSYMEEFYARPLSSLEYDVIQSWVDKNYSINLIKGACDLAKMSSNKSIRYIDSIIFEENKKSEIGLEEYQKREKEKQDLAKIDWLNK